MKKWFAFAMVICILLAMTACTAKNKTTPTTGSTGASTESTQPVTDSSTQTLDQTPQPQKQSSENYGYFDAFNIVQEETKNYKLLTDADNTGYCYYVYDNAGELLDSGYHDYRGCSFAFKDGYLSYYNAGLTFTWYERYYDVENGRVSRFYYRPLDTHKNLVAYYGHNSDDEIVLIVSDMFDKQTYYCEFAREFSLSVLTGGSTGSFSEDGKSIRITYLTGADYEQITEEFALQPPAGYLIQENADNVISFPIPYRSNMSAEEMSLIQNYLHNEMLTRTGEKLDLTYSSENVQNKEGYLQYSILMKSWVAYESDTHVSIVWTGLFNAKGAAHPTHWLLALNYNPQTLQIIPFTEKYTVNNQLYTTFADLAETAIKNDCGGTLPAGWNSFRDPIPSENAFLNGLTSETEFYYYLQAGGVTISYPVVHPIGDHKEVTIPYDKVMEQ